ncbi:MAG: PAS domain S-box protein, partial [Pseudomonadota bacterium]
MMTDSGVDKPQPDLPATRGTAGRTGGKIAELFRKSSKGRVEPTDAVAPQVMIYTREAAGDFRTTFMSENVYSQLGYRADEFMSNPSFWIDKVHPEDVGAVRSGLDELLASGYHALEYRFLTHNGNYRWVHDEANLFRDEQGTPSELLGSWLDVTDRRRVEKALRESEARHRSLVDSSPVGMISFDMQGEVTEVNPAVLTILGGGISAASECRDIFSLLPIVESGMSEAIHECLKSGEPSLGEFQYASKNNRLVHTRLHVVPIRDGDRRIVGAHAFVQDISDQKRAEELIIRSERLKVLGQISRGVGHDFNNL